MTAIPEAALDLEGRGHHAQAADLLRLGPVVRASLAGVGVYVATTHSAVASLAADPRVSRDYRCWSAWKDGRVTEGWPLYQLFVVDNMFTADGESHRLLRHPVSRVLSPGRIEEMLPAIERAASVLLDELPGRARPGGAVDIRRHYAYKLPMSVVSGLVMGVPEQWWPRLEELVDALFRTDVSPEEAIRSEQDRISLLNELIRLRAAHPGDDLTSELLRAPRGMTPQQVTDTIWLMLTAGHETTAGLITNAIHAITTHKYQGMAMRGYGRDDRLWFRAVSEIARWDPPVGMLSAGYATQDIPVEGSVIPAGEAVIAAYISACRDPAQHGDDAPLLSVARRHRGHLAFGTGPHACPGASLAQLEAVVALRALFARYPKLALAVPSEAVPAARSLVINTAAELPVYLTPPAAGRKKKR